MAERRMFSKSIINSARFLRMPSTSRLLYYDLGMAADDDGVVEAFTVLRTTGATEDDLRVLVAKGFVVLLNDDLVTYIVDWKQNNSIRKDRYTQSIYSNLLVRLSDGLPYDNQVTTDGLPYDNQVTTDGCHRLGKDSIGKDSIGESGADKPPKRTKFVPPPLEEVAAYCRERGNGIDPQRFIDYYSAINWMVGKHKMKDWKAAIRTWEANRRDSQQNAQEEPENKDFELIETANGRNEWRKKRA